MTSKVRKGVLGNLYCDGLRIWRGCRVPVLGTCVSWAWEKLLPRDSRTWVQVQRGPGEELWLHLHPRTGAAYFEGGREPGVQQALQEHLRPGMTSYDIGANVAFFPLLAARLLGKEGRVVAFEAEPDVAARMREHMARNALDRISMEENAMLSETGWCILPGL